MFKQLANSLLKTSSTYSFKETVCYKRSTPKSQFKKRTTLNPGVQGRASLLNDKVNDKSDAVDIDEIESLESDFMNVGISYKEHEKQIAKYKDMEKVLIVKQKYFKERLPNFLTWNDKKQIQYLHKTNPDEWTLEKLSEGFPALPHTIKKIIKASWSKKNSTKIINHDNAVKRNWELFKNHTLNLPPDLANHLSKFTKRNYDSETQISEYSKEIVRNPTTAAAGEFSEIIKSYKRNKNDIPKCETRTTESSENRPLKKSTKEMYLSSSIDQRDHTTLKSLRSTLVFDASLGKNLDEDDKILLQQLNDANSNKNENNVSIEENSVIDLQDIPKTAYLSVNTNSKKDSAHLIYPEKIVIPKEKLRKDCVYKLYDCYYDSDGLFLYRVPGMEK